MSTTAAPKVDERWIAFANEVGIELKNPPEVEGTYGSLDVLSAEWLAPEADMEAIVELRIKTSTGRVLNFDMVLELEAVSDATDDYDVIEGEFVEHSYNVRDPKEVARYFGEVAV